jgi:hypothetical protein
MMIKFFLRNGNNENGRVNPGIFTFHPTHKGPLAGMNTLLEIITFTGSICVMTYIQNIEDFSLASNFLLSLISKWLLPISWL